MTELEFPGGLARLDNDAVWGKLRAWIAAAKGRQCVLMGDDERWTATLCEYSREWECSSRLGAADAVANALQAAEHDPA
jgi:hypothetical protein